MATEAEEARDSGGDNPQPRIKPNFEGIAELIRNDGSIHSGEARSQKAAADNAKLYTRIEKEMHGNKDAAKAIRRIVKMPLAMRDDFMRTFEGLADFMDLWPPQDLVDAAEGKGTVIMSGSDRGTPKAVHQVAGQDYDPDDQGGGDDDAQDGGDEDEHADDVPPADPQAAGASPFKTALDASRGHLGTNDKEPAAKPKKRGGKASGTSEASLH